MGGLSPPIKQSLPINPYQFRTTRERTPELGHSSFVFVYTRLYGSRATEINPYLTRRKALYVKYD